MFSNNSLCSLRGRKSVYCHKNRCMTEIDKDGNIKIVDCKPKLKKNNVLDKNGANESKYKAWSNLVKDGLKNSGRGNGKNYLRCYNSIDLMRTKKQCVTLSDRSVGITFGYSYTSQSILNIIPLNMTFLNPTTKTIRINKALTDNIINSVKNSYPLTTLSIEDVLNTNNDNRKENTIILIYKKRSRQIITALKLKMGGSSTELIDSINYYKVNLDDSYTLDLDPKDYFVEFGIDVSIF